MAGTNSQIAHRWAQRRGDRARTGNGNLYYDGDTIYSYGPHFPIARFVTRDPNGAGEDYLPSPCVLFTTRSHGVTTTNHKSEVRGALRHNRPVFYVPNVMAISARDHRDNAADYITRAVHAARTAKRARTSAAFYANTALDLIEECRRYCAYFHVAMPDTPPDDFEDLEDILRRARAAAAEQAAVAEKEAQERAARIARHIEVVGAAWRAGDDLRAYTQEERAALREARPVLLRVIGEGDAAELETSMGARVPLRHAIRAYHCAARVRALRAHYNPTSLDAPIRVGHFTIDAIDASGNITAGCHFLTWDEMHALAVKLGVATNEEAPRADTP